MIAFLPVGSTFTTAADSTLLSIVQLLPAGSAAQVSYDSNPKVTLNSPQLLIVTALAADMIHTFPVGQSFPRATTFKNYSSAGADCYLIFS